MIRAGARAASLCRPAYIRYLIASAGSLGLDLALFLALLHGGVPAAPASGLGYAGGIAAHWLLSSRAVFADELAGSRGGRARQQALFVASALVGLATTIGIVGLGSTLGIDPRLAKLAAIAVSFQAVWLIRRHLVFAR